MGYGILAPLEKRIAPQQSQDRRYQAYHAPFVYRLVGVSGAGGLEATAGIGLERRKISSIDQYRIKKQLFQIYLYLYTS